MPSSLAAPCPGFVGLAGRGARLSVLAGGLLLMAQAHAGAPAADPAGQRMTLSCAVRYAPQQSVWQRSVVVMHDAQRVRSLLIDGQTPYTFSVHGQVLSTALDNEQIQIDLARGMWRSDFRGLASGQGPCEFGE